MEIALHLGVGHLPQSKALVRLSEALAELAIYFMGHHFYLKTLIK